MLISGVAALPVWKVGRFSPVAEASFLCDMSFIVYRLSQRSIPAVQLLYNFRNGQ
jgi:hypothetical protein